MTKYEIERARELLRDLLDSAYECLEDEDFNGEWTYDYWSKDVSEHADVLHKALDTPENIIDVLMPALKPLNVSCTTPVYDELPETDGECPVCGGAVYGCQQYCETCGQELDWSDSDE